MQLRDLLQLLADLPANALIKVHGWTDDETSIDTAFYDAHHNIIHLYT